MLCRTFPRRTWYYHTSLARKVLWSNVERDRRSMVVVAVVLKTVEEERDGDGVVGNTGSSGTQERGHHVLVHTIHFPRAGWPVGPQLVPVSHPKRHEETLASSRSTGSSRRHDRRDSNLHLSFAQDRVQPTTINQGKVFLPSSRPPVVFVATPRSLLPCTTHTQLVCHPQSSLRPRQPSLARVTRVTQVARAR